MIQPLAKKLSLKMNTNVRLCERVLSSEPLINWEQQLFETFQDDQIRFQGGETSFEASQRAISLLQEIFLLTEH